MWKIWITKEIKKNKTGFLTWKFTRWLKQRRTKLTFFSQRSNSLQFPATSSLNFSTWHSQPAPLRFHPSVWLPQLLLPRTHHLFGAGQWCLALAFHWWIHRGPERLKNIPKETEPVQSRVWTWTCVSLSKPKSFQPGSFLEELSLMAPDQFLLVDWLIAVNPFNKLLAELGIFPHSLCYTLSKPEFPRLHATGTWLWEKWAYFSFSLPVSQCIMAIITPFALMIELGAKMHNLGRPCRNV